MDVDGKKALVFGGTSGIGLATSKLLQARGATVVAVSRSPDRAGTLDKISFRGCDVRDEKALASLFAAEAPFDILVSSATGGDRAFGPFLEMEMQGYRASFDKLWGYANVVRYGAPHLSASGTIVLVSGAPARRMKPGQIALSSVGGAVEAFARGLAKELAPRRINVVSPGQIDTPMVGLEGEQRETFFKTMTGAHAIPRAGTSEEVAHAILFAVENDYITGATIDVDGGWTTS